MIPAGDRSLVVPMQIARSSNLNGAFSQPVEIVSLGIQRTIILNLTGARRTREANIIFPGHLLYNIRFYREKEHLSLVAPGPTLK